MPRQALQFKLSSQVKSLTNSKIYSYFFYVNQNHNKSKWVKTPFHHYIDSLFTTISVLFNSSVAISFSTISKTTPTLWVLAEWHICQGLIAFSALLDLSRRQALNISLSSFPKKEPCVNLNYTCRRQSKGFISQQLISQSDHEWRRFACERQNKTPSFSC